MPRAPFRLIALLATALASPLAAQAPGRVTERIVARTDSTQSYALYVPSAYTEGRAWPVLFLMDPRGRALVPLELFREAAERHGWLLLSSYRTLSDADSASDVNERAINAMLVEAQSRFRLDTRRFYLAGFSGTARNAWLFAEPLGEHLAGVIAVGGGYPLPRAIWLNGLPRMRPFAHFGTAGTTDFNHDEMRRVHADLASTAFPRRFVEFDGTHSWPPKAVAAEALEWMQLLAMKQGLAERDDRWLDSLLTARRRHAASLDSAGKLADALEEHRSLAADFEGLRDIAPERARFAEMDRDPRVRRAAARRDELGRRVFEYRSSVSSIVDEARAARQPPSPERLLARLRVADLKREAADTADRDAAFAARRMLEHAFSVTASYEARAYLQSRDFARALAVLRVAGEIHPGNPFVCYSTARAHAQLGATADALQALACAVDAGAVPAATLERDPLLEPLRAEPRFTELKERARARPAPPG